MRRIVILISVILITACTPAGGVRPGKLAYPPGYLKSFPIGTLSEQQLFDQVGPPDREFQADGKKRYVYKANAAGNMTYTYIVENGLVTDVVYNENGSLNGISAKSEQKK